MSKETSGTLVRLLTLQSESILRHNDTSMSYRCMYDDAMPDIVHVGQVLRLRLLCP